MKYVLIWLFDGIQVLLVIRVFEKMWCHFNELNKFTPISVNGLHFCGFLAVWERRGEGRVEYCVCSGGGIQEWETGLATQPHQHIATISHWEDVETFSIIFPNVRFMWFTHHEFFSTQLLHKSRNTCVRKNTLILCIVNSFPGIWLYLH